MTYKSKLLTYFAILFGVFAVLIIGFQWQRDRKARREVLENRLETYADLVAKVYERHQSDSIAAAMQVIERSFADDLQITVLALNGQVLFEHWALAHPDSAKHNAKPEVQMALHLADGEGRDIRMANTGIEHYYYSKRYPNIVVRVALPFDATTQSMLQPDNMLLWFVVGLFPFVLVALVYTADRFGKSIESLRTFVDSAERGLVDYDHIQFPSGELGRMGRKVVDTYRRAEEGRIAVEKEKEKKRIFKRQMSNNISHELRTPVAAIQGYLETIVNNPTLDEQQARYFISRAYLQSQRLTALIRDVALITKMEEAAEKIPREWLNLFDTIEEVVADLQPFTDETRVTIENRVTDDVEVMGNYSLIYSVFRNLIENSMKYAAPCHCVIEVKSVENDAVHFRFYDNGQGLPEKHLSHIFERFYRAEEGRTRDTSAPNPSQRQLESGTGLGLSIVRNAIAFHGGCITASNRAEGGLQFDFFLRRE